MLTIRTIAATFFISVGVASGLSAQTGKECTAAAKTIASGSVKTNQQSVFLTITGCGATGATAFATGIPKNASVTDTARLERYMSAADNWRDASIYAAATRLAKNANATVQARVFAIRHLLALVVPTMQYYYRGLVIAADTTTLPNGTRSWASGCQGQFMSEPRPGYAGIALPAGYDTNIRATLAALATSPSAPKQVRAAASCLLP